MLLAFLLHLALTAALLMVVASAVRGVEVRSWGAAFLAALVLGLVNAFVRPLMVLLTIPITLITFGLFLLVINALMLWLVAAIVPGLRIAGFGAAFWGALLLTVLNLIIGGLLGLH